MGAALHGADADELDRLAAAFRQAADELDADGGRLTQLLGNVTWMGDVAGRFVGEWTGVRVPQIGLSTGFLRRAATQLSENAAQQRSASGAASGSIGPISRPLPARTAPDRSDDPDTWDALEDALAEIGLGRGAIKSVIDGLSEFLGPEQVRELLDNLLTPGLVSAFKAIDGVLDVAGALISMAQDFSDHAHLPMDERLVHAVTDATISFALAKGVDAAITWGMTALGSVVPVLGTGIGFVAGKAIGFVIGEAVEFVIDSADDAFDIKDRAADLVVDGYRDLEGLAGGVADVVDGAVDVVGDVGNTIIDAGGAVVGGIDNVVGGLFD